LMNLSSITDSMLVERMVVHISISGRDLAGNPVQGIDGKPAGTSISTWNMQWFQPEFTLSPSSLSYSRLLLEVGDSTSLTLEVENIGTLDGEIEVVFKSIELDGTESLIQRTTVIASAGSIGIVTLDWGPQRPGFQWVEATLANGQTASGPTIDVRVSEEPSLSEKVFGDVNPILGSVTGLLFVAILATLLLWMKRMTTNQGAKVAFDWDEFSSEIEDDHDDGGVDDLATRADPSQTESPLTSSPGSPEMPTQASEPETDWVMGSDGYWWYHDKVTNEWWYKDADSNIVKHP